MIEVIKELAKVLKDLPDLAIWIMVGILFYKVFIIGGSISLVKYAITKWHSYLTTPKKIDHIYNVNDRLISTMSVKNLFEQLLDEIHTGVDINSEYIHERDLRFAIEAIREKRQKEK